MENQVTTNILFFFFFLSKGKSTILGQMENQVQKRTISYFFINVVNNKLTIVITTTKQKSFTMYLPFYVGKNQQSKGVLQYTLHE